MFLVSKLLGGADNKKAMSAIITVVLLLLLTIGVFLVISGWQDGFVSNLTADVEKEAIKQDVNSKIEAIEDDELYFNNAIEGSRNILEISIDNKECDLSSGQDIIDKGMNILNISSCVNNISQGMHEVLIVTDEKVYKKTIYVRGDSSIETGSSVGEDLGHLVFNCKKNNLDIYYETGAVVIGGNDPKGNMLMVEGDISSTTDICIEGGSCISEVGDILWDAEGDDVKYDKGSVKIRI